MAIAYIEGIVLVGLIWFFGGLKGFSFQLGDIFLLIVVVPSAWIAFDNLSKQPTYASALAGFMGGVAVYLILTNYLGFFISLPLEFVSYIVLRLILEKINKNLFPEAEKSG